MGTTMTDYSHLISDRANAIDVSGIRRVFELGAKLKDPINLSIGQPDFKVPEAIKQATIEAIHADRNGYTLTQGDAAALSSINSHLKADIGWDVDSTDLTTIVTSGTSGAIFLASLAMLNPGDEAIIGDPYFVIYPAMGSLTGASIIACDTYPDFRMTAERVEPLITDRTKMILVNSPGNPSGVVLNNREMRDLVDLCERRGIVLVSDEIYDEFTYDDAREDGRCPSPARFSDRVLLVRGFGKTYGCTGWRMGYASGPTDIIRQMAKLQQYTFVCAPSIAQAGLAGAFAVDMSDQVSAYQRKRDAVEKTLGEVATIAHPGGAFYAFVEIPEAIGLTGTQFSEMAIDHNLLVIPGGVFSERDSHFRISYAVSDDRLATGLGILRDLLTKRH